jgi:hypothetical protein
MHLHVGLVGQPVQDLKRLFVRVASCLKIAMISAWHLIGPSAPRVKSTPDGQGV